MTTAAPGVRAAGPADADTVLALVDALADYEKLPRPDAAARAWLREDGFGDAPRFHALIAEGGDPPVPVGLAVEGTIPPSLIAVGSGFLVITMTFHLVMRWRAPYADPLILPIATLLNGLGLVMINRLDLAIDDPMPRWSHYVFCLHSEFGAVIETVTEKHGGPYAGTHARYVLRSSVTLVRTVRHGQARDAA